MDYCPKCMTQVNVNTQTVLTSGASMNGDDMKVERHYCSACGTMTSCDVKPDIKAEGRKSM